MGKDVNLKKNWFPIFTLILVLLIVILGGLFFSKFFSSEAKAKELQNFFSKDTEVEAEEEEKEEENLETNEISNEIDEELVEENVLENKILEPLNVNEEKPNELLEKISKSFNSLDDVVSLNKDGSSSLRSSSSVDSITIFAKGSDYENSYVYKLAGNLLTASGNSEDMYFAISASYLEAAISKLYNVNPKDVYDTMNSEQIKNYTIEDGGFTSSVNDNTITYVLNISTPLKLVDFSNTYITEEDLQPYSDMLRTPGFVQATINGIIFHKQSDDSSIVIAIGEENEVTDKTYNSAVSFVKMIYGAEEAENFKSLFPDFKGDNKFEKDRYKIQINPKLTETEKVLTKNSSYKITRITIKK